MEPYSIDVESLTPGAILDADVLVDNRVILRRGRQVTPELIIRLKMQNVAQVYTSSAVLADKLRRSAALTAEMRELLSGDHPLIAETYGIPPRQTQRVMESARAAVADAFRVVRGGGKLDLDAMRRTARSLIADVLVREGGAVKLGDIPGDADYAPHHAVNVALLLHDIMSSVDTDTEKTEATVLSGLLHDIGETRVSEGILTKSGALTTEEFSAVKQHPALGAKILREAGADEQIVAVALEHHEKYNGTGYPRGIRGDDTSLVGQAAGVCDVFDALTTTRSYRRRVNPAAAVSIIVQSSGSHFSPEAVRLFVQKIGVYPVGTCVRLSSEQVAVVVKPNELRETQPTVRVIASLKGGKLAEPIDVDLSTTGISVIDVISI